jgi:hypothetical protein
MARRWAGSRQRASLRRRLHDRVAGAPPVVGPEPAATGGRGGRVRIRFGHGRGTGAGRGRGDGRPGRLRRRAAGRGQGAGADRGRPGRAGGADGDRGAGRGQRRRRGPGQRGRAPRVRLHGGGSGGHRAPAGPAPACRPAGDAPRPSPGGAAGPREAGPGPPARVLARRASSSVARPPKVFQSGSRRRPGPRARTSDERDPGRRVPLALCQGRRRVGAGRPRRAAPLQAGAAGDARGGAERHATSSIRLSGRLRNVP